MGLGTISALQYSYNLGPCELVVDLSLTFPTMGPYCLDIESGFIPVLWYQLTMETNLAGHALKVHLLIMYVQVNRTHRIIGLLKAYLTICIGI